VIISLIIVVVFGLFVGIRYFLKIKEIGVQTKIYNEENFPLGPQNCIKFVDSKGQDPVKIIPGEEIQFIINFKNLGGSKVSNVELKVKIPEHLDISSNFDASYSYHIDDANRNIIIDIGELGSGQGDSIKIKFRSHIPLINGLYIKNPEVELSYMKANDYLKVSSNNVVVFSSLEEKIVVYSKPDFDNSTIVVSNENEERDEIGNIILHENDKLKLVITVKNDGTMDSTDTEVVIKGIDYFDVIESNLEDSGEITIDEYDIFIKEKGISVGEEKRYEFILSPLQDIPNNHIFKPVLQIKDMQEETSVATEFGAIIRLFPSFENSIVNIADANGGDTYAKEQINLKAIIKNTGKIAAEDIIVKIAPSQIFVNTSGKSEWHFDEIKVGNSVEINATFTVSENISSDINAGIKLIIGSSNGANEYEVNSNQIKIFYSKPFEGIYIPIIGLHGVEPYVAGRWETSTGDLDYLCGLLKSLGYQTITLADLRDYLVFGKALPEKPIIITSDDGYQSVYSNAFPIMKKYGFKMSVFLLTGYIGNSESDRRMNDFDKNEKSVTRRPMLIWPEIAAMSNYGFEFGSHGISHAYLDQISLQEAENEIRQSKADIEANIKKPCIFFSWPHGSYNGELITIVSQLGYGGALRYSGGVLEINNANLFNLPRVMFTNDISSSSYAALLKLQ
jgi:peptidoglycan/xylan/chitin deacetylase (PgdA/CDA1 family)